MQQLFLQETNDFLLNNLTKCFAYRVNNRCTTPFSFHAFSAQLLKAKPFKKSNAK